VGQALSPAKLLFPLFPNRDRKEVGASPLDNQVKLRQTEL
jgi:hypothetical protein